MEKIAESRCFGGLQQRYTHRSEALDCSMNFSLYLPPQAESEPVPLLYWLSGLTCSDENFVTKAGAQRYAAAHGVAILAPDTSPRGEGVPDDPESAWDFGLGAGFYVNATQAPWASHYRMYDYVVNELPGLLDGLPLDPARASIFGHSMGGHGALVIALRNPGQYRSVSAFAPICAPMRCPWGVKAFSHYLGNDRDAWEAYDASCLIRLAGEQLPLLVDQGEADSFLAEQLRPELLREAADAAGYPLVLRTQPGYDHSYFFISTFIGEHIAFHASHL
ncbi:S-formylglutathione hydrolase [Haliea sp. E17]|uniref:S-formylglutathione hydrolase n=1 Tax=Haliea sp. E17 TaxID=3401576 RepID=UPI003AAB80B8